MDAAIKTGSELPFISIVLSVQEWASQFDLQKFQ